MAELTFPSSLAAQRLHPNFGEVGPDEVTALAGFARQSRAPGFLVGPMLAARRSREARDAAILEQLQRSNAQNMQMYGDFMPRAEALAQSGQAVDVLKARPNAPMSSMNLRGVITPGPGILEADAQNLAQGAAGVAKTEGEAVNQNMSAAKAGQEAGLQLPPGARIDPLSFARSVLQQGQPLSSRNEHIKGQYDLAGEKERSAAGARAKITMKPSPVTGNVETSITAGNVEDAVRMTNEYNQSNANAAGGRVDAPNQAAVTTGKKRIEDVIRKNGAQIVGQQQAAEGNKIIVRYKVRLQDGNMRDLEYEIGPNGIPKRRSR